MHSVYSTDMLRISILILGCAALVATSGCKGKPRYPNCNSDKDCVEGEKCVNKRCLQCSADTDCPDGQKCNAGACESGCSSAEDCPDGQACVNGECQACDSDADCGPNSECRDGRCFGPGACSEDTDCAEDEDCIDGRCQRGDLGQAPAGAQCEFQTVFFGFDEYVVNAQAQPVVESNIECLNANAGTGVALVGHADPRGADEYNIALSDKRARAVMDYLGRFGVDVSRLRVIPQGESEATGYNEETWAEDRKVEFKWD